MHCGPARALAFLLLAGFLPAAARAEGPEERLVPRPRSLTPGQGSLALSRIVAEDAPLAPLAKVLADEILRATGVALPTAAGKPGRGDVSLRLDPALKDEAYTLVVGDAAVVTGGDYFSAASGTATLLQLVDRTDAGAVSVPRLTVQDRPAYSFRAALIDLARKYHSPGGIQQVIDLCRYYKIRYLHLHLTDDQLFMFPSTKYPQVGKGNGEFARFEPPSMTRIAPYTLEELKDLERFSQERGVHLVPELDLPGHSGRLVGDAREVFGFPGNGSTVHIASPKTLDAVAALLNEVMDVFQGTPYVHLGADEVGLGGLEKTPEYKDAQQRIGNVRNPHDLYCKFITDLHGIVAKRGKRSIVWEEAWNAGGAWPLPKDALVMVWSQGRSPAEIARSGYDLVNATWTPLYIVRDNKKSPEFLHAWELPKFGREGSNAYTTLADTARLKGAQLCSWENSESIEIQSMRDRLALVAEKAWNPEAGGTFDAFKARFAHTDARLDRLVHPVEIQVKGALVRDENTFEEPLLVTLVPRRPGLTLKYTLDNSMPNKGWKAYTGPIPVDKTVHLRAGLFDGKDELQGHLVGSWFRRIVAVQPNLATRKPVTVGPGPDRTDAWAAKVAVDGQADNVNAHWASTDPAPQWLQIDLEKVYPVDHINVITYYDGSRYYQLTAEVSVDGKTWKKVLDFSDNKIPATAAGHSGTFPKTDARYVKIHMLKNSANPWVHIVEVIVNQAK
jgi:hexosaminidase